MGWKGAAHARLWLAAIVGATPAADAVGNVVPTDLGNERLITSGSGGNTHAGYKYEGADYRSSHRELLNLFEIKGN